METDVTNTCAAIRAGVTNTCVISTGGSLYFILCLPPFHTYSPSEPRKFSRGLILAIPAAMCHFPGEVFDFFRGKIFDKIADSLVGRCPEKLFVIVFGV